MHRLTIALALTAGGLLASHARAASLTAFMNDGSVGTFDTATPGTIDAFMPVAPTNGPEFEIGADGRFYASIFTFDGGLMEFAADGTFLRTVLSDPDDVIFYTGMEITDTTFYAARSQTGQNATPSTLGTVDLVSGTFTPIGVMTGTSGPTSGLAWDGDVLYAVTGGGTSPQLFSVDPGTGAATPIGNGEGVAANTGLTGLEFGSDGVLYALDRFGGASLDGTLYSVSTTTGVFTAIGDFDVSVVPAAVNAIAAPPIPEPASLALLGLGGLLVLRRRIR